MKKLILVTLAALSASSISVAEPRIKWQNNITVEGSATYEVADDGNQYCTHPKTRFAHALTMTSEIVVDKVTGVMAYYEYSFNSSDLNAKVLVNMNRVKGMPMHIAHTEKGIYYYETPGEMKKGQFDKGFEFELFSYLGSDVLQTVCSKK